MCNHYSFDLNYALEKMLDKNASLSQRAADGDCSNFTYLGSWNEHYKSWRDNKSFKVMFIKYEDLQDKKEEILREVINFVDQLQDEKKQYDEKKFLNAINSTSFSNLKSKEINEGFEESNFTKTGDRTKFFNLGFKNKWQNMLPKEVVDKLNHAFKNDLKELGYPLNE